MKWSCQGLISAIVASAMIAVTRSGAQEPNALAALASRLVADDGVATGRAGRPVERIALSRLYPPAARPLWSEAGLPTRQALESIGILATADTRGLVPADYGADALAALVDSLGARSGSVAEVARFDVTLSRAVVRLLADLHMGRVDPRALRFELPETHDQLDLAELASAVSRAGDVRAAVEAKEPPYVGYVALKRALARYQRLAEDTTLRPLPRAEATIHPGDRYRDAPTLRRLLVALGDLDEAAAANSAGTPNDGSAAALDDSVWTAYDGVLAAAVVRFQGRHGLEPDGVIGPGTMAQLRTPLARRVRQIELGLERWRWLPDKAPARYAVVNIPDFRLSVFEGDATARRPALTMNVIVGQAEGRHHTPVFVGTMREVVFRPYWDVPPRIARNELVPLIRRRPSYFVTEGFEIVRVGDSGADAVTYPPTAPNLSRAAAGTLRLRQRPGPTNALGAVKFVFPNPYNVFLHGTPLQRLFAYSRRDFSHGCIRIEQPAALAELVLRGQETWDAAAVDAAMHGPRTMRVPIARPMVVYVLYATTTVDAAGAVYFSPDIYGHDAALERALGFRPLEATRGGSEE
jgi:murein L,D-transpeptidase YcbB/YkuD